MNLFKKLIAVILIAVMALSFTACHKKNEIAVTVDGQKFTSAYYMCALLYADSEARTKVDEMLAEKEEEADEDEEAEEVDYFAEEIDGKEYTEWVKARALELISEIAAYKAKCKEADIDLDEETLSTTKQYAAYYWSSYGYQQMFEPNGVSEATFTQYMLDSSYSSLYFDHLYGEGGEKEIAADTMSAKTHENFLLADIIEVTYSEETDDEKAAMKETFDGYVDTLKKGTKTFVEVYNEYNGETEEDTTTEDTAEGETEEVKAINEKATVIGAEGTDYESDHYDTVKAMAIDEVKLIEKENSAGLVLIVKRDLAADEYYVNNLDLTVRHMIADEEFNEDIKKFADSLDTKVVDYAVNQFKVKKIVYPEASY